MGAQPSIEIIARGNDVRIEDRERGTTVHETSEDPMSIPADMSAGWRIADDEGLPRVFTGGWVGYSGYDTVRYVYSGNAHSQYHSHALQNMQQPTSVQYVVVDTTLHGIHNITTD